MKSITREWEEYRQNCIHEAASKEQLRDMQQTFYAGAKAGIELELTLTS